MTTATLPVEPATQPTERVIRVIDFEATGDAPPEGEVIQWGFCDLVLDGANSRVLTPQDVFCRVRSCSPETRAVHHIHPDETSSYLPFDPAHITAAEPPQLVAYAAHNTKLEATFAPALSRPLLCTYKAALRAWPEAPSHKNAALLYWLEDQGFVTINRALARQAHRAGPDSYITAHLLRALIVHKGVTGKDMLLWTREPACLPRCPIGVWRGRPWAEVDDGFLDWILSKRDMGEDIAWCARRELERRDAIEMAEQQEGAAA